MKNNLTFSFLLAFLATSLFSQSNINQTLSVNSSGAAAEASAQFDVSATEKGILVPRMTTAQRTAIATPATSLLVFDTDTGGFWFYNGIGWVSISPARQASKTAPTVMRRFWSIRLVVPTRLLERLRSMQTQSDMAIRQ